VVHSQIIPGLLGFLILNSGVKKAFGKGLNQLNFNFLGGNLEGGKAPIFGDLGKRLPRD